MKIERKLSETIPPYSYHKYLIKSDDGREGNCSVFIDLVRKCSFQFTKAQMKRFRGLGIKNEDLCICLDNFHPHGRGLNPDESSFMRRGFGADILKEIIQGLRDLNAKFIYSVASTLSMKSFLEKQGWSPCDRRKNVWYFLLKNLPPKK